MSAFVIVLSGFLVLVFGADDAKSACPERCKCDPERNLVDCRNAGLTRVPWNLPDPSGLKQLDLRGNNIKELIAEIISYNNLEYLDLSDNELLTIDEYALHSLPRLKYLYLKNNNLGLISNKTFQRLSSLIHLDLSNNKLETVVSNVFKDLTKLVVLDLSRNSIRFIHGDTFRGLESLKSLVLNSNRLERVSQTWWRYSPSLDTILLDMNRIATLPANAFEGISKIKSISIEGNDLVDISAELFGPATNSAIGLEKLSLKHNKLRTIPTELLGHLKNLESLDLSQNLFEVIDPDAFKGLDKLESVHLNALPALKVVRDYSFSELLSLRNLELHSNPQLYKIEPSAFLATPNINSVDLHGSKLSELNSDLLPWRSLHLLDLRQNPWHCSCSVGFLAEVLRNLLNQSLVEAYILQDVICATPSAMEGRRLIDLPSESTECSKLSKELGVTTEVINSEENKFSDKVIIAVIGMFVGCFIVCLIVLILRTRRVTFHRKESNRVRSPRRLQRRRHLAAINGSCNHYTGTEDSEKDVPEDRMSITGNAEGVVDESDDVFAENGSVGQGKHRHKSASDSEGHKPRRVSFADFVQVRTCPLDEDLDVCPI